MAPSSPPTIPDPLEKTVGQRERTTLLTIIAALAKEAKIDVTTPSAAGVAVEALTEAMNVRVPARTVEEHLKRIPDALERRAKTSS
jgi:predicted ATP-grasp superfamily ATP-dependent carboligase